MKAIAYLMALISLAGVLGSPRAFAQELVWAADAEGGAPYTFPDPRNPARIIGFEVDLANALAERMGRKARFVQNQWDGLVPGLQRGEYDVVINGLEITAERAERINFSNPYFYSTLTITRRVDDSRVERAEDLRGLRVGVLKVTFAEKYVENLGKVTIRSYDGQVQPLCDDVINRPIVCKPAVCPPPRPAVAPPVIAPSGCRQARVCDGGRDCRWELVCR